MEGQAPNRWTAVSYGYAALAVLATAYFLLGMPVQLTDSYGNLVQVARATSTELFTSAFSSVGYWRPLLWVQFRMLFDLSGGHYFLWFRGWHVAQVALLLLFYLRLFRPRTMTDAAAVPVGVAAFFGIHTFAGIREAFPINTFVTVVLCCFIAMDLARGEPRWWKALLGIAALAFVSMTVEIGLLVAVVLIAAYITGDRGIGRTGLVAVVLFVAGYLYLRFIVFHVGAPGLIERASGYGFSVLEPDQLTRKFGANPWPFYAYNVVSSALSLALSEPRAGVWALARGLEDGDLRLYSPVNVLASVLGSALILSYVWRRRREWIRLRFEPRDRLVVVGCAVAAANAVISYPYTKDIILSPAGGFFALALACSVADLLARVPHVSMPRQAGAGLLLVLLSSAWAFRHVGSFVNLRFEAINQHNEWAYAEQWFKEGGIVVNDPVALRLKDTLQMDAIRNHPMPPLPRRGWEEFEH